MKSKKIFQLIFVILICILISLVGFLGIYQKKNGTYQNQLPQYTLASDLKGSRVLEFEVDTTTEKKYYDKDGNLVDSETVTDENKSDYKEEEVPINASENLNIQNYKQVLKIMKNRLQFLKTDQYRLDLDEKTGKIVLTFEDDYPEDIESILPMVGSLELKDSNTKDIILDSTHFQSVDTSYASVDAGYMVYLNFHLNQSGIDKINSLEQYKNSTNEETGETSVNQFSIEFDDDQIVEVSYDAMLLIGKTLRITTHEKLTSNSTIQSAMNTNTVIAKLATIGKMPITYQLTAEEFIKPEVENYILFTIILLSVTCVVIAFYWIVKYKIKGLLASIGFSAIISLFLIVIRLTNIPISMNGFAGMFALILLNLILVNRILINIKNTDKTFSENVKEAYLKTIDIFVVTLIAFVVLAFSSMTVINSAGLLIFWGWIVILLGNLLLTIPMLAVTKK